MPTIHDRFKNADTALSKLEGLRPDDPAAQNARDDLKTMRGHISQLHYENWQRVRADLDSRASAIEDKPGAVPVDAETWRRWRKAPLSPFSRLTTQRMPALRLGQD